MRVVDAVMGTPYFCHPENNVGSAAELMWKGNCGGCVGHGSQGKSVRPTFSQDQEGLCATAHGAERSSSVLSRAGNTVTAAQACERHHKQAWQESLRYDAL